MYTPRSCQVRSRMVGCCDVGRQLFDARFCRICLDFNGSCHVGV